ELRGGAGHEGGGARDHRRRVRQRGEREDGAVRLADRIVGDRAVVVGRARREAGDPAAVIDEGAPAAEGRAARGRRGGAGDGVAGPGVGGGEAEPAGGAGEVGVRRGVQGRGGAGQGGDAAREDGRGRGDRERQDVAEGLPGAVLHDRAEVIGDAPAQPGGR